MKYKELLDGLTIQQFNEIAENWYSRLNKLKAYFVEHQDSIKAQSLILQMIARMEVISFFYIRLNAPSVPPKSKFKSGCVMVEEPKGEVLLFHGEKIISI